MLIAWIATTRGACRVTDCSQAWGSMFDIETGHSIVGPARRRRCRSPAIPSLVAHCCFLFCAWNLLSLLQYLHGTCTGAASVSRPWPHIHFFRSSRISGLDSLRSSLLVAGGCARGPGRRVRDGAHPPLCPWAAWHPRAAHASRGPPGDHWLRLAAAGVRQWHGAPGPWWPAARPGGPREA